MANSRVIMRSLLFVGATLMAGAGIYGFVEYKKKEQNRAFKSLYIEEKPVEQRPTPEIVTSPVRVFVEPTAANEMVFKTNNATGKKAKKGRHKRIKYTQFSRAIPTEVPIEEMEIEEPAPPVKELQ